MTNQLIPVFNGTISNEPVLLCNARDLHTFLEVGKNFSNWIVDRISEYEFVANLDYIVFTPNLAKTPGRRRKDYHLTLDTAKELAMVERNEMGRQIRRYFIDCEKQLHQHNSPASAIPEIHQPSSVAYISELKLCITLRGDKVTSTQVIGPDTFVGSIDNIVCGLRERGWIVIRRDALAEKLAML